jgi:hypothetical protein
MTVVGSTGELTQQGVYFFLSYAHSAASAELTGSPADPSVAKFFADLSGAVIGNSSPSQRLRIAFFDQEIPTLSDLKGLISEALGRAEVFVPLYSPKYFELPWPMREREVFLRRLQDVSSTTREEHFLPVLWTPFPTWADTPAELDAALDLGDGVSAYAENGMRALCMLAAYRDAYGVILQRLAARIVRAAERSPLGPSRAPTLDEVHVQTPPKAAAFAVAVLAPLHRAGPLFVTGQIDPTSPSFENHSAPEVAQYSATIAERLGFWTKIIPVEQSATLARSPAIVLVDPEIVVDDHSPGLLESTFKDLPGWVLPLVIGPGPHSATPPESQRHLQETIATLNSAGRSRVDVAEDLDEFASLLPRLVYRAHRTYLRTAPVFPPATTRAENEAHHD